MPENIRGQMVDLIFVQNHLTQLKVTIIAIFVLKQWSIRDYKNSIYTFVNERSNGYMTNGSERPYLPLIV